ncbi:MAG: hypothetical protein B6242_11660 [Anaerolineaceae bacterium 4572_78]|nr:MAG: hypothetical protein B6242_11660 [Anaerolineaceae bacterium 4572_78]
MFFWQNGRNAPKTDPASKLVVDQDFFSPIAEAYRVLRTNIQFSKVTNPSPIIGDGHGSSRQASRFN